MFGMGLSNVPRYGVLGDGLPSIQWKRLSKRTRERCVKGTHPRHHHYDRTKNLASGKGSSLRVDSKMVNASTTKRHGLRRYGRVTRDALVLVCSSRQRLRVTVCRGEIEGRTASAFTGEHDA